MRARVVFVAWLALGGVVQGANAQSLPPADEPIDVFASLISYQNADFGKVEKNFLYSLDCSCEGVVESAIAEITRLKLVQLQSESEKLHDRLASLSINGQTPAVRFKAYLASVVFAAPALFAEDSMKPFKTQGELFSTIADRLQRSVLVAR